LQNDVFLSGLEAFEELKNQIYKAEWCCK
jgi:hypothetical protein